MNRHRQFPRDIGTEHFFDGNKISMDHDVARSLNATSGETATVNSTVEGCKEQVNTRIANN